MTKPAINTTSPEPQSHRPNTLKPKEAHEAEVLGSEDVLPTEITLEEPPPLCNSGIVGRKDGPNIVLIIPYDWWGVYLKDITGCREVSASLTHGTDRLGRL